jgi:hypothetical protein
VHLAQPPDDREDEPPRPLPVGLELLGERERLPQVARHQCVREVVDLRGAVRGGEALDVGDGDVRARVERERHLLELARQPLLALADPPDKLLGRVLV